MLPGNLRTAFATRKRFLLVAAGQACVEKRIGLGSAIFLGSARGDALGVSLFGSAAASVGASRGPGSSAAFLAGSEVLRGLGLALFLCPARLDAGLLDSRGPALAALLARRRLLWGILAATAATGDVLRQARFTLLGTSTIVHAGAPHAVSRALAAAPTVGWEMLLAGVAALIASFLGRDRAGGGAAAGCQTVSLSLAARGCAFRGAVGVRFLSVAAAKASLKGRHATRSAVFSTASGSRASGSHSLSHRRAAVLARRVRRVVRCLMAIIVAVAEA